MFLETPYEMALNTAKIFRELRKRKNITIKTVSEKSGVPYSTVRRFERLGEISFVSLVKLVSAIGEDAEITGLFAMSYLCYIYHHEYIVSNTKRTAYEYSYL